MASLPWLDELVVATIAPAAARPFRARGLTLVGISLTNLEDADALQLTVTDDARRGALDAAVDRARDYFGTAAVMRAVLVGPRSDLEYPLLPD